MITVFIVDDHELVRVALSRLLSEAKDIKVVGEASSGEEAITLLRNIRPEVLIMDVKMPGIGGLEATRKVLHHSPKIKILVVSSYNEEPFPSRLLQAGALGYITKGSSLDEVLLAIRTIYTGKRYLSPEIAQSLALGHFSDAKENPLSELSARELQVLIMITSGLKAQDIALKLNLSPKTVNSYRYRIFDKLKVATDVELTHLAMRHGLLDMGNLQQDQE